MKKEFEKEQKDNQIDDAFLDMPDMEDDEKFRQWLEEEYLKEADAIEDAVRKVHHLVQLQTDQQHALAGVMPSRSLFLMAENLRTIRIS